MHGCDGDGRYRDTTGAARYLGVSKRYLEQLRCRGDGPIFISLSRRRTYDIRDLDAWVAARKRKSTSEQV